MDAFKIGYFFKGKRFIQVGELDKELSNKYGYKIYKYYNEQFKYYGIIGEQEFSFLETDTPENRLFYQLKYD
jgi:hypothetical protein